MQFEGSQRNSHIPNLMPLIDIVFLSLIFFMLAPHFVHEDTLNIPLVEARSGQSPGNAKNIEIIINVHDQWLYQDKIVNEKELTQLLREDLAKLDDKQVLIRGDKTSNLNSAVSLMDIARKAGATGVEIITENR